MKNQQSVVFSVLKCYVYILVDVQLSELMSVFYKSKVMFDSNVVCVVQPHRGEK